MPTKNLMGAAYPIFLNYSKAIVKSVSDDPLKSPLVILNEVKNLTNTDSYKVEILRLTPQNDVIGQVLKDIGSGATLTLVFKKVPFQYIKYILHSTTQVQPAKGGF